MSNVIINPSVFAVPESTELWSTEAGTGEEALSSAVTLLGQLFETGHVLIGKTITRFDVNLSKQGLPTNNITAQILDNSNVEKLLLKPLVPANTLPIHDTYETKSFTADTPAGGCVLADGDRLVIGGSFSDSARPVMQGDSSSESYTNAEYYNSLDVPPSWNPRTYDFTMSVWGY